jgi:hypothetical protein
VSPPPLRNPPALGSPRSNSTTILNHMGVATAEAREVFDRLRTPGAQLYPHIMDWYACGQAVLLERHAMKLQVMGLDQEARDIRESARTLVIDICKRNEDAHRAADTSDRMKAVRLELIKYQLTLVIAGAVVFAYGVGQW